MPDIGQVKAAQELRLRFLYAVWDRQEAGDERPLVSDCMADIGYPDEDWPMFQRVTGPLEAEQMITGIDTDQHGLVKVSLTPNGRRLVEDKATGADRVDSPASIGDVKIEGSGNILQFTQHSPGSQMHAQVDYEAYDLHKITDWVYDVERRVAGHGLQPDDEAEVLAQVAELKAELALARPDPSKVQRIGRLILRILGQTGASLASAGLIETGQRLIGG